MTELERLMRESNTLANEANKFPDLGHPHLLAIITKINQNDKRIAALFAEGDFQEDMLIALGESKDLLPELLKG
jgi:hypothetical protein